MFTKEKTAVLKEIAPILVNSIPKGAIFAETNQEKIIWKLASDVYDVPAVQAGVPVRTGGAPYRAMRERMIIEEKVPRAVYGMRVIMKAIPIIDDGTVTGAFLIITPRLHPVAGAFHDFAPMIADMFHEGAFLYMTDLQKFSYRQPSKKFDMPTIQIDDMILESSIARKAINTKQLVAQEVDDSVYGVPVMVMNYPCFDEDDPSQVVATFGIIMPRKTASDLREMSNNLSRNLEEVSSVIEELAASATNVSSNEQQLNSNIRDIFKLSEEINEVLEFIKQIADETKMLGLNAAIEAARAGDAGRGFGVVAEEIRKLSDESKNTVTKIRDLTESINQKVDETVKNSEVTMRANEEQAAATEEMSASIEEITSMADQLDTIARAM